MKFTVDEIKEAQAYARRLQLKGWQRFCDTSPELLQRICNGTGADWMPESARRLLDLRHPTMKVPVMIHDEDFYNGDGTDADFKRDNDNLYENGCMAAKDQFWCINPRRYLVMWDARKLSEVCQLFGRKAYNEAIAMRLRDEAK